MVLKLNQMQNHIMENLFLFHAYINSRSNKNSLYININTLGCSIDQQEMVWDKIWTVNHVKNVKIRYWRNPEDKLQNGPIGTFQSPAKEPWRSHPLDGSSGRSITTVAQTLNESTNLKHRSFLCSINRQTSIIDHRYVERIDKPRAFIATSNKSTNLKDWIAKTLKESRSCIRTHKPF